MARCGEASQLEGQAIERPWPKAIVGQSTAGFGKDQPAISQDFHMVRDHRLLRAEQFLKVAGAQLSPG